MTAAEPEQIVVAAVRRWTREAFPDESFLLEPVTDAALDALAAGASVGEACRVGRQLLRCARRHPSTGRAQPALHHLSTSRGDRP